MRALQKERLPQTEMTPSSYDSTNVRPGSVTDSLPCWQADSVEEERFQKPCKETRAVTLSQPWTAFHSLLFR